MNFIISVNDDPTYFPFLEKVVPLYKSFGHEVNVAYVTKDRNEKILDIDCDSLMILDEVDGYESGIQAKLARSFYASKLEEEKVYTLLDVDQFLINFKWLEEKIDENYSKDYDLLAFGANGYKTGRFPPNPNIDGKFPMYFTSATPRGFRKLYDIDRDCEFSDLLSRYSVIENPRDGYESTKNPFRRFSDESLFAWMIRERDIKVKHVDLEKWRFQSSGNRIDRAPEVMVRWRLPNFDLNFWQQKKLSIQQKQMILNMYFFDVFPARPYGPHKEIIDDILDTILMMRGDAVNNYGV
jgi:hypothetical protein